MEQRYLLFSTMTSNLSPDYASSMICRQSCPRRITAYSVSKVAEEIAGLRKVAFRISKDGREGSAKLGLLTLDPNHITGVYLEAPCWSLDRLQKLQVERHADQDVYRFLMASNPRLGLAFEHDTRPQWDTVRRRQSRTGAKLHLSETPSWFKVECEGCDPNSCWYTIRPWMEEAQKGGIERSDGSQEAAQEPAGEWNVAPIQDDILPPPYPVHLRWRPCERKPWTWCFMRI
ncbi:hypothetical protein ACQY0O_004003 [Thecaphora frezii]